MKEKRKGGYIMTEYKILQFPAIITSISTKMDCLKVTIETSGHPEGQHSVQLLEYQKSGVQGWFTFNVHEIQPEDIADLPKLPRVEKGQKTPSERLRAIMFVAFTKDARGYKDFDEYYKARMEGFIDHIKKELD